MKKTLLLLLSIIFLAQVIYFNIVYDFMLLLLLFFTALSFGSFFRLRVFGIDKVFISLAIGLGLTGCLAWLSTFYNFNYKSVYLIVSILIIYLRKMHLYQYIQTIKRFGKEIYDTNFALLVLLIVAFIFYIIASSAPIDKFDSLTKHIAIPIQMLTSTNYDYNVVESIVFGDYALLSYSFYLYLLALGGTKSLVLFNTILSFLGLISLLRISSFLSKDKVFPIIIVALYISMPLLFSLSTILYIDLVNLYFIFAAYLLVQYSSLSSLRKNLYVIALLSGFAMFTKATSFFYIIPMIVFILYRVLVFRKQINFKDSFNLLKSIIVFFSPFLPSLLIVWYKTGNPLFPFKNGIFQSEYFPLNGFADPFHKNILGMDFQSLHNIVYDTSRNVEMIAGGAGVYVLLAPIIFLGLFLSYRNKKFIFIFLVSIGSYWLATKFSYNIRYFLGSLILIIPAITYVALLLVSRIKYANYLLMVLFLALSYYQGKLIFDIENHSRFKDSMLTPDERLTIEYNSSILDRLPNKEKQYVLSNNDPFRGTFTGHFYALNWHNSFLLNKLRDGIIKPRDFLAMFDYYLVDKRLPYSIYTRKLDPVNNDIRPMLEKFAETSSHILYTIKKHMNIFQEESFSQPLIVDVAKPTVRVIQHTKKAYKIQLDVEKVNITSKTMGRFQVNWLDEKGTFLGTSLVPFTLEDKRGVYKSSLIENIPVGTKQGVFYLTTHDKTPMKVYGYKILSKGGGDTLSQVLQQYGKKFPHLSKD